MNLIHTLRRAATAALAAIAVTAMLPSCSPKLQYTDAEPAQFETLIAQPDVQLLDVRTPAEFMEGHIEGARNVDWLAGESDFADRAKAVLTKGKPVAVYCRSGRRSAAAAQALTRAGFKHVTNLTGGILGWQVAGHPLVK